MKIKINSEDDLPLEKNNKYESRSITCCLLLIKITTIVTIKHFQKNVFIKDI